MTTKYPGGFITKVPPTVTPPVDGEGGSAPGIWTMDQALPYIKNGTWPRPLSVVGPLYMWGYNDSGQLGQGNRLNASFPVQVGSNTNWRTLSGGQGCTGAVTVSGTLFTWGSNDYGKLGLGNTTFYSSPVQVGSLTTWSNIAVSMDSMVAVKSDGTLWSWGRNNYGQLGLGNITDYSSPVQIGALTNWSRKISGSQEATFYHAIKTDGTLWAWGQNDQGYLGNGNASAQSSPVQIGALTTWVQVSSGGYHAGAIRNDGTLWMWGQNSQGELGRGNTSDTNSPVQVGALTTWASVSCGNAFTLAVRTNGTLWAWGNNGYGQLGLGDLTNRSSPVQVGSITSWSVSYAQAVNASFVVRTNGDLWAWGRGQLYQLGIGNNTDQSSPVQVSISNVTFVARVGSLYCGAITR